MTRTDSGRGFTIVESLVVLVLLALTATVAVPIVTNRIRTARLRVAAKQFMLDLEAARFKAVSNRTGVDVIVTAHPANVYSYTAPGGGREMRMPPGVRITSSTTPIRFRPNGLVAAAASTVLEVPLIGPGQERWTITTSLLGIPRATYERISP